jgi:4'-phosphopantetheinyl transferase
MWAPAPAVLTLGEDEVHVWRAELKPGADATELDAEERERVSRLRFERDRAWFTASHSALRRIVSRYVHCPPAALEFARAEMGKPYVEGPIRFSMAHSGGLALYAIAHREIGVDVEQIRPETDVTEIAERFLPAPEALELASREPPERQRAFFRLWTRREAYLKARGIGLSGVGESIGATWFVEDLDPGEGYAGAVATEAPEPRILTWTYSPTGAP